MGCRVIVNEGDAGSHVPIAVSWPAGSSADEALARRLVENHRPGYTLGPVFVGTERSSALALPRPS